MFGYRIKTDVHQGLGKEQAFQNRLESCTLQVKLSTRHSISIFLILNTQVMYLIYPKCKYIY